jgi:hypothetical protein
VNDKEFRQHLSEWLARQRRPDQPAKKNPPTPELTPKPATMSNKEFREHIRVLLARERNEGQQSVEKKPPTMSKVSNPPYLESQKKPPAKEKRPATEGRKFNVRRKVT